MLRHYYIHCFYIIITILLCIITFSIISYYYKIIIKYYYIIITLLLHCYYTINISLLYKGKYKGNHGIMITLLRVMQSESATESLCYYTIITYYYVIITSGSIITHYLSVSRTCRWWLLTTHESRSWVLPSRVCLELYQCVTSNEIDGLLGTRVVMWVLHFRLCIIRVNLAKYFVCEGSVFCPCFGSGGWKQCLFFCETATELAKYFVVALAAMILSKSLQNLGFCAAATAQNNVCGCCMSSVPVLGTICSLNFASAVLHRRAWCELWP